MDSRPGVIRNLREAPEPPWLDHALVALEGLEGVRFGPRKDRFGGMLLKTVRACIEAYLRRFATLGIAPMLEITASDLHQWRVELGVSALDRAGASRVLNAWHDVVASLAARPQALTAEDGTGRWITVRLRDQHHEQSHEHRYWAVVSMDDGAGVHEVFGREKGKKVRLGEIVTPASRAEPTASSTPDVEAPQGEALAELRGFVLSFFRDLGVKQVRVAYAALRQGRREGWSRQRTFLAIVLALVTACGVWYWRVVHYAYTTALVSRSGPMIEWGAPRATQPVFWLGKRVGHIEYNRPAPDIIRLRYFRETTVWCPKHHIVKNLLAWRLSKNGHLFYTSPVTSTPWCEVRLATLPEDPIDVGLSMRDGAIVNFRTGRGGIVDITTLQPEGQEPSIIVTATESPTGAPVMTGAQSTTTTEMTQHN